MTFVRFDIQVTEQESAAIAKALEPHLGQAFTAKYDGLIKDPGFRDKHKEVLYRSKTVQDEMERQGLKDDPR